MMEDIRVSVIIPVYNMEKYLEECLKSAQSQTLREIEIIAVNDGSQDRSLAILQSAAREDPRIKIIDKANEGVGAARNDGIRAARGEFISFLDSDDCYTDEEVLETLYRTAKENGVRIAGGQRQTMSVDGASRKRRSTVYYGMDFHVNGKTKYSDFQFDYGYWQYIYDRKMLVENEIFFPAYRRFQDPPFFVRAMICAGEFYAIDKAVYDYRYFPANSKTSLKNTVDFLHGIMDDLALSRENDLPKLHYLTALRLNKEGSFMATPNMAEEGSEELLYWLIRAGAAVDEEWLRSKGFSLPEPFVLDVFRYLSDTAAKYEKLRNNRFLKPVRTVFQRVKGK